MEYGEMFNYIDKNKEWIFSGVGILVLAIVAKPFKIIANYFNKNNPKKSDEKINDERGIYNNEIDTENKTEVKEVRIDSTKYPTLKDLKNNINILFIDDDTKFKVVNILKNAGFNNVKIIKDIKALDSEEIRNADILFIDIQGVGRRMNFKDEGLGLANALMEKYKNKKKYIIYSAESTGNRFDDVLRKADDFLSKDADPYQFESIIEKFFLTEGSDDK